MSSFPFDYLEGFMEKDEYYCDICHDCIFGTKEDFQKHLDLHKSKRRAS